jgi:hypothetical protein
MRVSVGVGVVVIKLVGVFVLVWCVCCGVAAQSFGVGGRVYEMVSPVFKGGYSAVITAVASGGERVVFGSTGDFAGEPSNSLLFPNIYVARRVDGVGWSTAPLLPPVAIAPLNGQADFSPSLESALNQVRFGPSNARAKGESTEQGFLLHSTDAPDTAPNAPDPAPNFEVAGMVLKDVNETPFHMEYIGGSTDFSHIVFEDNSLSSEQLLSEAAKSSSNLYDLAGSRPCGALSSVVCRDAAGGGGGSLRLLGLNNEGKVMSPSCQPTLGTRDRLNAVSADGSEIFFTDGVTLEMEFEIELLLCVGAQVFVRLGGERTLEVSRPLSPGCAKVPCVGAAERKSASFQGASEDGSKVFFSSAQSLVPGETDASNNLYLVSIGCPESEPGCEPAKRGVVGLVRVSRDPNVGESAGVKGVVAVAPDGSRTYFVASGDLLSPAERGVLLGEGRAAPRMGADNLYVYDSVTGSIVFIADLCSGSRLSGAVEDGACPPGLSVGESDPSRNDTPLWVAGAPTLEAQLNVCALSSGCTGSRETGRFLVFSSYAQLAPDDTDMGRDVYRYDAVTGALVRVSGGEGGYDANGNGSALDGSSFDVTLAPSTVVDGKIASEYGMNSRAVSEDGSRVVFTTAEPLSPAAANGLSNAYEWFEGGVSLVSGGSATRGVEKVLLSSSGHDVFFTTTQGLVPQDTDGQADVYDARLEGGFPPLPVETEPCSGDACQGPLMDPAPLLIPGSVPQAPGENLPPAAKTPKTKPRKSSAKRVSPKRKHGAKRARRARTHARQEGEQGGRR